MIEFVGLMNERNWMSVLLKTEFGDIKLLFESAWGAAYTDVKAVGDGWEVVADNSDTKAALARILSNLTRERFDKLKALGSLPNLCQYNRYFYDFEKITVPELVSVREAYDSAKNTVNRVVSVSGEKRLILPGRAGPELRRVLVKCKGSEFFRADLGWDEFKNALDGKEIRWSKASPDWVWRETKSGIGPEKAVRLLKELNEEGFKRLSAAVLVGQTS